MVPTTSSPVITTESPVRHSCGPSANRPSRIFGPCRSARTATGRPAGLGGLADQPVDRLVVGVAAVAEVEPRHVHAGLDETADALRGRGGGTESADDLRAACHAHQASLSFGSDSGPTPCRQRNRCPTTRGARRAGGRNRTGNVVATGIGDRAPGIVRLRWRALSGCSRRRLTHQVPRRRQAAAHSGCFAGGRVGTACSSSRGS